MNRKDKRNLITAVIVLALLWWYWPKITGAGAMRPQPSNQVQYTAPAPIYQAPAPQQPLYVAPAPAPQQQPQPSQAIIMPTAMPQPTQQPQPVIIDQVATRDWTNEITAVNRNLDQAVKLVQVCALEKMEAAASMPPKLIDCSMTVENLERAKEKVLELQQAISDYNEVNQ